MPRLTQVVVFPTPPFWFAIAVISVFNLIAPFLISEIGYKKAVWKIQTAEMAEYVWFISHNLFRLIDEMRDVDQRKKLLTFLWICAYTELQHKRVATPFTEVDACIGLVFLCLKSKQIHSWTKGSAGVFSGISGEIQPPNPSFRSESACFSGINKRGRCRHRPL